jgi:hypothetical protein
LARSGRGDPAPTVTRLWRARRRHAHIDAILGRRGRQVTLTFARNDRPMLTLEFPSARSARAHARARLRELEIAGWIEHW